MEVRPRRLLHRLLHGRITCVSLCIAVCTTSYQCVHHKCIADGKKGQNSQDELLLLWAQLLKVGLVVGEIQLLDGPKARDGLLVEIKGLLVLDGVHVVPELGGLQDVAGHGDLRCGDVTRGWVYSKPSGSRKRTTEADVSDA